MINGNELHEVVAKKNMNLLRQDIKPVYFHTSAQILPTVKIVSTGYNPRRVSAPKRIASQPENTYERAYDMLLRVFMSFASSYTYLQNPPIM